MLRRPRQSSAGSNPAPCIETNAKTRAGVAQMAEALSGRLRFSLSSQAHSARSSHQALTTITAGRRFKSSSPLRAPLHGRGLPGRGYVSVGRAGVIRQDGEVKRTTAMAEMKGRQPCLEQWKLDRLQICRSRVRIPQQNTSPVAGQVAGGFFTVMRNHHERRKLHLPLAAPD